MTNEIIYGILTLFSFICMNNFKTLFTFCKSRLTPQNPMESGIRYYHLSGIYSRITCVTDSCNIAQSCLSPISLGLVRSYVISKILPAVQPPLQPVMEMARAPSAQSPLTIKTCSRTFVN